MRDFTNGGSSHESLIWGRVLLGALLNCGCGSELESSAEADQAPPDEMSDESQLDARQGSAGAHSAGEVDCERASLPEPDEAQMFQALTVTLTEGGAPAAVRSIQVCSFDVCLYGDPAPEGFVDFRVDEAIETRGPALKLGDGVEHATLAYRLPPEPVHQLDPIEVISLPLPFEGVAIAPGEGATFEGVTLHLAVDSVMKFDRLVYPSESDQLFRVALRSNLAHPSFPSGDALIVAAAPEGTEICPPASLTVPNQNGWAPGSTVLLSAHGAKLKQEDAAYGGLGQPIEGKVSDDGTMIHFIEAVHSLGVFLLQPAQ